MKVKFIGRLPNNKNITTEINEFMKDKKIIDIKYSVIYVGKEGQEQIHHSVMIMYEDA